MNPRFRQAACRDAVIVTRNPVKSESVRAAVQSYVGPEAPGSHIPDIGNEGSENISPNSDRSMVPEQSQSKDFSQADCLRREQRKDSLRKLPAKFSKQGGGHKNGYDFTVMWSGRHGGPEHESDEHDIPSAMAGTLWCRYPI